MWLLASQDVPVLELEPPRLGAVKIEPDPFELLELLEVPEPLLVALLEPEPLLFELLLELLLEPEPEEPLVVTDAVVAAAVCVSPHTPAKTPSVAAATPMRRLRRAASRAAGELRLAPAEAVRAGAT